MPYRLEQSLLEKLLKARHVMVLTGAGMSAESGIPTFRDAQTGMWAKYQPEDLATPEAFQANPERVWRWYEERRARVREAMPHDGHYALVELASLLPSVSVVTQNVDGLHQLAGSRGVIELHGNITRSCCSITRRPISKEWMKDAEGSPPPSPYIRNGLARPDVVWFGEVLPQEAIDSAVAIARSCDFCFSVGTTSLVHPAASLPLIAVDLGVPLVDISPHETRLCHQADPCRRTAASQALRDSAVQAGAVL